jgi:ABC-type taurine transport system ATPase subunit
MNDKVGACQQARGAQRQQVGIARPGTDEPQLARQRRLLFHAG